MRSILLVVSLFLLLGSLTDDLLVFAQQKVDSPVFKHPPLPQPPMLKTSDVLEDIWQTFLLSRKANAGDPLAQYELGVRYMIGKGIEADSGKAAYWFSKAAAQNMLSARFNLGILSFNGWGVSWNPFEAFKAFRISAEGDLPEAEYIVGLFYAENMVVPLDYGKSLSWVRKAAAGGDKNAKDALPDLERAAALWHERRAAGIDSLHQVPLVPVASGDTAGMTRAGTLLHSALLGADPDMRRALGLARLLDTDLQVDTVGLNALRAAADVGSPEALALIGRCEEQGVAVVHDDVAALASYVRATRMGSPRASELLLAMLQKPGVLQELKTKARHDDPEAQFAWSALHALGFESILMREQALMTPAQAVQQLKKAAEGGYVPALIELGLWYFSGRWVAADEARAAELWERAAHLGSREAGLRLAAVRLREERDSAATAEDLATVNRGMEDGSVLAEVALGYCREMGRGVPVNVAEAVRLYRVAARRGSLDAYRALRRLHDLLRPPDPEFVIREEE
jgi:TPR repeat protein